MNRLLLILIGIKFLFLAFLIQANENIFQHDSFQISGFGTIAATHVEKDAVSFYREYTNEQQTQGWSIKTDSILGLQLNWDLSSSFSTNLQVVAKDRVKNGAEESLEWANLRYQINDGWSFRAGRMGVDIYMLSEYRNVSYAYLWARPINEFYQPVVFNYFDGIDLAFNHYIDSGTIQFRLFGGNTKVNLSQGDGYLTAKFSDFLGFNLTFEQSNWKLRFAATTTKITDVDKDPIAQLRPVLSSIPNAIWSDIDTIEQKLEIEDKRFIYYSAGFSYDKDWTIQSEIAYLDSKWEYFPSSYSGYLSVGKRLGTLTPYVVLSGIKMAKSTYKVGAPMGGYDLEPLRPILQSLFNQMQLQQHSLSFGIRWDFKPQMALKAQWTHTEIHDGKSALWAQNEFPNDVSSKDIVSVQIDFLF